MYVCRVKYFELLEVRWNIFLKIFFAHHCFEEFPYQGYNFQIPEKLTQLEQVWYFCFQEPQGMDLLCGG